MSDQSSRYFTKGDVIRCAEDDTETKIVSEPVFVVGSRCTWYLTQYDPCAEPVALAVFHGSPDSEPSHTVIGNRR